MVVTCKPANDTVSLFDTSVVIDSYEEYGDSVVIVMDLVVSEETSDKELSSLLAVVKSTSVLVLEGDKVLGLPNDVQPGNVELLMMFNVVDEFLFEFKVELSSFGSKLRVDAEKSEVQILNLREISVGELLKCLNKLSIRFKKFCET